MNIIKCRHAKEQGLKHYFTGKPCKYGHFAERLVSNGACSQCRKKWQQDNPEYFKQYRQENREHRQRIIKQWKQNNPDKINALTSKRRASKIQRTPHWLTEDDFWLIKEAYALAKLREKATGIKWHVDHVVPLQGETVSGLHVPWNLQVVPGSENHSKHNNWNWDEQR